MDQAMVVLVTAADLFAFCSAPPPPTRWPTLKMEGVGLDDDLESPRKGAADVGAESPV